MKSFLVELVSNASIDIYPDNTLSAFTNFLPEQINLEGDWEVAVMEIGYPALFHNITEGKFRYKSENENTVQEFQLPKGHYQSLDLVRRDIIHQIGSLKTTLTMNLDHLTGKIKLNFPENSRFNVASNDLANILGFPAPFFIFSTGKPQEAPLPADIQRIHSVMIYSDIVEHGVIGSAHARGRPGAGGTGDL